MQLKEGTLFTRAQLLILTKTNKFLSEKKIKGVLLIFIQLWSNHNDSFDLIVNANYSLDLMEGRCNIALLVHQVALPWVGYHTIPYNTKSLRAIPSAASQL